MLAVTATRVSPEVLKVVTAVRSVPEETRTLATLDRLAVVLFSTRREASTTRAVQVSITSCQRRTFTNQCATDTPGLGGVSGSGDAEGGDAAFRKRALNSQTAGGNAQSGDSSNTSSGSIFNEAEDDGEVTNMMSSE